jgi:hypothetical protein
LGGTFPVSQAEAVDTGVGCETVAVIVKVAVGVESLVDVFLGVDVTKGVAVFVPAPGVGVLV